MSSVPVFIETNNKIYTCRQGHQWEGNSDFKGVGMQIGMPDGTFLTTGSLCPYCLVAYLKEHFGSVTEVQKVS
jgi:hypothetical protein